MSMSLAELRAAKDEPASLPMRTIRICLNQKVLADIGRLVAEQANLVMSEPVSVDDDEKSARPRRASEGRDPRFAEIDAELEALYEKMREAEGDLTVRAGDGGAWLRWKAAHPPRPDNESDLRLGYGLVDTTDLLENLGEYVVAWNGEEFAPGEWDAWFKAKVAPADLGAVVNAVVEMHENRIVVPKSSTGSSARQMNETA